MVEQQSAINTVKNFAEAIRNQGVDLKTVILFGSFARGEQREWSDIDVALVADEVLGVSFEHIKRFIDVTIQRPFLFIEPHTFNDMYIKETEKMDVSTEINATYLVLLLYTRTLIR